MGICKGVVGMDEMKRGEGRVLFEGVHRDKDEIDERNKVE